MSKKWLAGVWLVAAAAAWGAAAYAQTERASGREQGRFREQELGTLDYAMVHNVVRSETDRGCRVAFAVATRGGKQLVVVDGRAGPEYDKIGILFFSPDGQRVAYMAAKGDKRLVVVDGQAGPEYDEIGSPVFSPDGQRVAYWAGKGGKWLVVVDGRAGPEYEGVMAGPVFRRDGVLEFLSQKAKTLYRVTVEQE